MYPMSTSPQLHGATIVQVAGPVKSAFEDIVGDVMVLLYDCGHWALGNPSMHYKVGARVNCRKAQS